MSLQRSVIHPAGMTSESGRWSHASMVAVGDVKLIFVAGQTARFEDGKPLPNDDFAAQFRRVYESLGLILTEAGATFGAVVSMRTFLTRREDIQPYARLRNAAHAELFPDRNYPPNTLLVVDALASPELLLEVEAVAIAPA